MHVTAQQLHALGIAVVPASGKRPALSSWIDYLHQRPTADDLRGWIDSGLFDGGIGVLSGSVSGVICLDFDDPQFADEFAQVFPALQPPRRTANGRPAEASTGGTACRQALSSGRANQRVANFEALAASRL